MDRLKKRLLEPINGSSIAFMRIALGLIVAIELIHYSFFRPFMAELYLKPAFHFKYPFFEWVPDLPAPALKVFLVLLGLSWLAFALGWQYKWVKWTSFLGMSYLFLMERASFLNHWYLTCLLGFLFLFIPAQQKWSLDARRDKDLAKTPMQAWHLYILLGLTGLVYFFSGLVKIHPDWMSGAPMDHYLATENWNPPSGMGFFLGLMALIMELVAFPLLLWKPTRWLIMIPLLLFHLINFFLFTIGMFPILMISLTLLFLPEGWPQRLLDWITTKARPSAGKAKSAEILPGPESWKLGLLAAFFLIQIWLPLRAYLYPGNILWSEDGFLFSWRMMMDAKTPGQGNAVRYFVRQPGQNQLTLIDPAEQGLTWAQKNKLVRNPDLVLQYAQYLGDHFARPGQNSPEVFADIWLGLNGRPLQRLVHPNVDLNAQKRRYFKPYPFVMPLEGDPAGPQKLAAE